MFHFLKKHAAAAAKEGKKPEEAASVPRSPGDRLDSSLAVSVGLCVLVFIVLQWMGSYSPHWGKSVWHHVSEAFLLFSVTLALMPMYWLCAGSLRRKNKTFVVTWGAILVQLLFFGLIRHVTADITSDIGNELLYLPYMMAPLIVTVLLGPLLGMFATISICMLGGFFILPEQYVPEKQVQFWILIHKNRHEQIDAAKQRQTPRHRPHIRIHVFHLNRLLQHRMAKRTALRLV